MEKFQIMIGFIAGLFSFIMIWVFILAFPWPSEDHTHKVTGVQDGAVVCVHGLGVVDYNSLTERPFLLCGVIEVMEKGEAPPLDLKLTQS